MTDVLWGTFAAVDADEPYPGVVRRSVDAQGATATRYEFRPGAAFPLHRHPQEQITLIEQGDIRMRLGAEEHEFGPGGYTVVPGGVEHGITAGADGAVITAIVVPRRAAADAYEEVAV
ncbi:MAG: cupin domain-containing protein [Conexibacter sp.]